MQPGSGSSGVTTANAVSPAPPPTKKSSSVPHGLSRSFVLQHQQQSPDEYRRERRGTASSLRRSEKGEHDDTGSQGDKGNTRVGQASTTRSSSPRKRNLVSELVHTLASSRESERSSRKRDKILLDTSVQAQSTSLPGIDITSPVQQGEEYKSHTHRYLTWPNPREHRRQLEVRTLTQTSANAEHITYSEEEDGLFSLHPTTLTAPRREISKRGIMARGSSSHAKGRSEPGGGVAASLSSSASKRRNSKHAEEKMPDRHELMRRAMAEATGADIGAPGSPDSDEKVAYPVSASNTVPADPRFESPTATKTTPAATAGGGAIQASDSNGSAASTNLLTLDKPGDGHLSFDSFVRPGEGEFVVHADGNRGEATNGEADGTGQSGSGGPPKRPKLGSRNNSFQGSADQHEAAAVAAGQQQQRSLTPSSSPANKLAGHARYSTTGSIAAPTQSRQASLAVPGSNGVLQASPDAHQMHHSATMGNLNPSPLSRFRKLSDAGLSPNGKKGTGDSGKKMAGPSGGIAGALAASGMAGMGVGNQAILQEGQQALVAPRKSTSPTTRRAPASRRSSSLEDDFVAFYQGGVYRDPSTGTVIERGPDSGDEREQEERRMQMMRSRSATGSTLSLASSDLSQASGLNAAANFSAAVAAQSGVQAGLLTPDVFGTNGERSPLAEGMVGSASGGGLGERTSLGDEGSVWHGDMGGQITGFAVASSKRNAEFHALFPSVPEDDYLIEDYGCALVREILIQGRFYISENHVCFYANIFGWVTNIALPFSEIVSIEKRMTALIIPNAIQVATLHVKHTFASFLSRDATYDLIVNIWKLSHPEMPVDPQQLELLTDGEESVDEQGETDKAATGDKPRVSKRALLKKKLGAKLREGTKDDGAPSTAAAGQNGDTGNANGSKSPAPGGKRQPHPKTSCPCDKDKLHLSTTVLDNTYPAIPEKLYNLFFTSEYMKEFWTDDQKLLELHVSEWAAPEGSKGNLKRDITYIKPLAGGFGPKQTKCVLQDENDHVDFDDYVTVVTTTRTPDVPSGGSFCVKTRTCFTWAGGNVTKVYVTCQVEWSGRSMIKGIIDKASIDGQKQYYKDLDSAIRRYIKEHAEEFKEEGDDDADAVQAAADDGAADEKQGDANGAQSNDKSADAAPEGLMGHLGMLKDVASGAFDMVSNLVGGLGDALGGASPSMLILGFVVILLLISNLWAFSKSGSTRDPLDPHRLKERSSHRASASSPQHHDQGAEAVAGAIREVLKEYFEPHQAPAMGSRVVGDAHKQSPKSVVGPIMPSEDPVAEAQALATILEDVEQRLAVLKQQIGELQSTFNHKQEL